MLAPKARNMRIKPVGFKRSPVSFIPRSYQGLRPTTENAADAPASVKVKSGYVMRRRASM
jgi:hypothetical protein